MGTVIYRPDLFEDFYVAWSSIVEAPVCWGPRMYVFNQMVEWDREKEEYARERWEVVMGRATMLGSSSQLGGDNDEIFEQRGILPFANMRAFVESFDVPTRRFDLSLLVPFEDLDEVRGYDDA